MLKDLLGTVSRVKKKKKRLVHRVDRALRQAHPLLWVRTPYLSVTLALLPSALTARPQEIEGSVGLVIPVSSHESATFRGVNPAMKPVDMGLDAAAR